MTMGRIGIFFLVIAAGIDEGEGVGVFGGGICC